MNTKEAWALVGGLSKPSKMPGWSIGIPAKECNTGSKLVNVKGSVCEGCYALKGCYVFKVVQEAHSLTAIAIAAHEVGHAIQDQQGDKRLATRTKMIPIANMVARWSVAIISLSPIIGIITRHPMPFSVLLFLGLSGFIARMMIHAVTLPIEYDASFSKALPILREGNYISQDNEKAVSRILNAAALTYVSAALADILNLGRWLVILSRR